MGLDEKSILSKLADFYNNVSAPKPKEEELVKIGIVGSRRYTNTRRIREVIHDLQERFGDKLVIVSGGQPKGVDGYAKKWALYFGVRYVEFPPAHYSWNNHCINPPENYGRPYRVYYYTERNTEIAEYSDYVFCFIPEFMKSIEESKGTYDTYKKAKKLGKDVSVFY
jgi:hypothetical protein